MSATPAHDHQSTLEMYWRLHACHCIIVNLAPSTFPLFSAGPRPLYAAIVRCSVVCKVVGRHAPIDSSSPRSSRSSPLGTACTGRNRSVGRGGGGPKKKKKKISAPAPFLCMCVSFHGRESSATSRDPPQIPSYQAPKCSQLQGKLDCQGAVPGHAPDHRTCVALKAFKSPTTCPVPCPSFPP